MSCLKRKTNAVIKEEPTYKVSLQSVSVCVGYLPYTNTFFSPRPNVEAVQHFSFFPLTKHFEDYLVEDGFGGFTEIEEN